MHVWGVPLDFNWFGQLISAFLTVFGIIYLFKSTAPRDLELCASLDAGSNSSAKDNSSKKMPGISRIEGTCDVCGNVATNRCSGCKAVRYCSYSCQAEHWESGHKAKCKEYQSTANGHVNEFTTANHRRRIIGTGGIALVPGDRASKVFHRSKQVLFPYDVFMDLFIWDRLHFTPCGLLNCGNSCFANVVLQCLAFTRPLVAFLVEKAHSIECRQNDWCFLCELQMHVEKVIKRTLPFSPISILSQLPNIGGNLGYGEQEDAHEFMRLAIDTMQSICLEEFGGEKAVHPNSQETTIIQHIFGGHLQSQIICSRCNKISNQLENMMDLTVEIHGDAASLEECLEQFTACEWLHGENMYKCEGCNDYVKASKRLTVHRAPNILTVALKRFQTGRFGKLNKRISFPETLDLNPYVSEGHDDGNIYKLYAVVVHLDMLNAAFFGHYICYVKDFAGDWYKIDDEKVREVELEELLSQSAYMLLYSRVCPRPSGLSYIQSSTKDTCQSSEAVHNSEPCIPDSIPANPELSGNKKILDSSTQPCIPDSIPANPELSGNEKILDSSTQPCIPDSIPANPEPSGNEKILDSSTEPCIPANLELSGNEKILDSSISTPDDPVPVTPISPEVSRDSSRAELVVIAPSDASSLDGDVTMTDTCQNGDDAPPGQGQTDGCDSMECPGETQMDGCDLTDENGSDAETVDASREEDGFYAADSGLGSSCLRDSGDGFHLQRQSNSVGG